MLKSMPSCLCEKVLQSMDLLDPVFQTEILDSLPSSSHSCVNCFTSRRGCLLHFHPQMDGQTERMNRTLEEMLRAFVSPRCDDWDTFLPCCEFAMNNAWNESIRTTPFFLNYGRHPRSPSDFVFDQSEYQSADYAQSI